MKLKYLVFGLFLSIFGYATKVHAHGTQVEYRTTQAIEIQAKYADGKPMAKAQVTVYAPLDPTKVWHRGITDEQGNFTFFPDPTQSGEWDIKVRQAGHGEMISVPFTPDTTIVKQANLALASSGYTPMQKLLMAATGTWGFVGTAMFFYRRNRQQ